MSVAMTAVGPHTTTRNRPAAPQHLSALARANEIRLARATLKRAIARDELTVAEVLTQCPDAVERMEIGELISCQRRWGGQRTRRLLGTVPVIETKLVGALTERQRTAIVVALGGLPRPSLQVL